MTKKPVFEYWREYKTKPEVEKAKEDLPPYKEGKIKKVKDKDFPFQLWIREKPRKKKK